MDTLEKLEYKIKSGIKGAVSEKEYRLSDRICLPLAGLHGEQIFLTGLGHLQKKAADLRAMYENVPDSYRVASVILVDAHSSATIEGAHTTVERMKQCLQMPKTKDEIMVANTYKGCMYAYEHAIEESNIRALWEIIVEGVCENREKAGELYRSGMVYVGSEDRQVHTPASVEQIQPLMQQLFGFAQESELDAIIQSFVFHFYFVYVHPFCDGNGRAARTINSSQLFFSGFSKVKSIAISTAINRNLASYYKAITDCEKVIDHRRKEGWLDISPFVDYMLDIFEEAMTSAALANNELSEMERLVLERMNKAGIHAEITVQKAMKITKLSESSTRNVLLSLTNQGYLQINKETRPYVYKLIPHM